MRKFDYTFLTREYLPPELLNITNALSELKVAATFRKKQNETVFAKLESAAKVRSVKSSNAIEGIVTTDRRVEQIVNQNSAPVNHSEMEIAGYRDALALIHQNYSSLMFDENTILRLHEMLYTYTSQPQAGHYKLEDNLIVERGADGKRAVRFVPVTAADTPEAMQQLVYAYIDAKNDASINKLLLVPCVILDFLCIHPFADGNGRLSRLLSLLLLYKAGFDAGKYVSFEEQIDKTKWAYYDALRRSSDGWADENNDYLPFVRYFIATLLSCYRELDKMFVTIDAKKSSNSERVEAAITSSILPLSKKQLLDILPDISSSTIERVLGQLLSSGKIAKIGTTRAAKYIKKQ